MRTCPECGKPDVTTEQVTETFNWMQNVAAFSVVAPLHVCKACTARWWDREAMDLFTAAQFKYEKSIGVYRQTFVNAREKKIWDAV